MYDKRQNGKTSCYTTPVEKYCTLNYDVITELSIYDKVPCLLGVNFREHLLVTLIKVEKDSICCDVTYRKM